MKPVYINFTDSQGKMTKTYSSCSLKTGTMDNIFDIAEKAQQYESGEMNIPEARQFFKDLKSIIVEVFAGQFTFDELNKNVEQTEVLKVFTEMCANLTGEMSKK